MLEGVNFAKDYQKDSYNKHILIEKIQMIKNINHIKKTLIISKSGILKL